METAIDLLDQRLRATIREGTARPEALCSILSALSHFDPSQVLAIKGLCLSWITDILNSRYQAKEQYQIVGKVMELAWKQIKHDVSQLFIKPTGVLSLLRFMQLSEEFYSTDSRSAPGVIALRILSNSGGYRDLGPEMLPILTSTLLPTHPLQSRRSALAVLHNFTGWFSSQMRSVPNEDRAGFLRAVGDPFQSALDISPQDEQHPVTNEYEPMKTAAVLIEFASSDIWRDHLRRSNFTYCEEVASTVEGKKSILKYMRLGGEPLFLYVPAKIIAVIERLEEIQCPNIAEVVLMCAWTSSVVVPVDRDAWRLIGSKTLTFHRVHGTGRLKTLPRCIMDGLLDSRSWGPSCRVEGVRLPVRIAARVQRVTRREGTFDGLPLARVCQLRRLYQLFGCDPATWEEMVVAEKVDKGVDVSSGQSLNPTHLMECACDYP